MSKPRPKAKSSPAKGKPSPYGAKKSTGKPPFKSRPKSDAATSGQKSSAKPGSRPGNKPSSKPSTKPSPKPSDKSTGKSGSKFTSKSSSKPGSKSGSNFGSKSDSKFGPKSNSRSKGPKGFKRRRPEENLDIQYTDKELGELSVIKRKLLEIREYKKILAEDGQKPDQQDKERESELIVRLLRIEKNAKMAARQRAKAAKTEAFREAAEKAEFAKQKKKARADRFGDDSDDDEGRGRDYDDDGDDDGDGYRDRDD